MAKVFLLLYIIFTVLCVYFIWSRRRFYKVFWQLGGPWGLPFLGLGLQMMKPEKYLQFMNHKAQQYKTPFISWMGTKCFLYVNDPETAETVFNSPCCTNKGDFYRFMANVIGDGLFTSNSPRWNKHRRIINPAFSRQVIHTFLPLFNQEANVLVNKLKTAQGQPLEMYGLLKKSVLETACQTTMGTKMNFHNDGSAAIFDSYNGITEVCVKRMLSPWLYPDVLYRCSSLFKRQQKYINILFEFVEKLLQVNVNEKLSTLSPSIVTVTSPETKDSVKIGKTILHHKNIEKKLKSRVFVQQIRSCVEEGQLTWQDVRDEANVIVAATFETTSTALYLVCLCLAMHPEIQEKLYSELVDVFPMKSYESSNCSLNPQCNDKDDFITLEHLDRMTYAEMVINEAMRLFAPVPMVLRQASSDFKLTNGIVIPKGTQIGIDIFNMQRNEKVWGPHATTFNPDEHFASIHKPHPFAFIPFTKGLRMCIGYRYALILMKIMLAKIFRNFRLSTDAKIKDLSIKGTISLKLCQYPLCSLQERK